MISKTFCVPVAYPIQVVGPDEAFEMALMKKMKRIPEQITNIFFKSFFPNEKCSFTYVNIDGETVQILKEYSVTKEKWEDFLKTERLSAAFHHKSTQKPGDDLESYLESYNMKRNMARFMKALAVSNIEKTHRDFRVDEEQPVAHCWLFDEALLKFMLFIMDKACTVPEELFRDTLTKAIEDKNFLIQLVRVNALALQYAKEEMTSDPEVVLPAILQNPDVFKDASKVLQTDHQMMQIQSVIKQLIEDREFFKCNPSKPTVLGRRPGLQISCISRTPLELCYSPRFPESYRNIIRDNSGLFYLHEDNQYDFYSEYKRVAEDVLLKRLKNKEVVFEAALDEVVQVLEGHLTQQLRRDGSASFEEALDNFKAHFKRELSLEPVVNGEEQDA